MTRDDARGDDGVTMIEVVVSLTLMAVLMTIFTTAVIQMYRTVNQTEEISSAQSNLNIVFLRLDKEVRYASGISEADGVGPDWYVEYLNTSRGVEICTELRLVTSTGVLQRRTWDRSQAPIQPSGWVTLASNVHTTVGTNPFDSEAPEPDTGGSSFQTLTITLFAHDSDDKQIAESTFTFAALNTSLATTSTDICIEGRTVA